MDDRSIILLDVIASRPEDDAEAARYLACLIAKARALAEACGRWDVVEDLALAHSAAETIAAGSGRSGLPN